jgi:hypothetical protein
MWAPNLVKALHKAAESAAGSSRCDDAVATRLFRSAIAETRSVLADELEFVSLRAGIATVGTEGDDAIHADADTDGAAAAAATATTQIDVQPLDDACIVHQKGGEEEEEEELCASKPWLLELSVVISPVFHQPQLLFRVCDAASVSPCSLLFALEHVLCVGQEERARMAWTAEVWEEHPATGSAWCAVHACRTADWMAPLGLAAPPAAVAGAWDVEYLAIWMCAACRALGVGVPAVVAKALLEAVRSPPQT